MSLNLETFKKMSQEEIKEYGKSLSEGYTRDETGNELSFKDSDILWREYTYDENGYVLTFKDSSGFWSEYTRDENGNVLTYKSSTGYWEEYTYDEHGRELTFKNFDGVNFVNLCWGEIFNLTYDTNTKMYKSGCQELSYEDCEKFYEKNKDVHEDSHNFIEAIRNHQKTLTESK